MGVGIERESDCELWNVKYRQAYGLRLGVEVGVFSTLGLAVD